MRKGTIQSRVVRRLDNAIYRSSTGIIAIQWINGPGVYTGPFWNRPGTGPKVELQNRRFKHTAASPVRSVGPDQFGSVWNRSRVNIALVASANLTQVILRRNENY